jgi:hypothetical protein
MTDNTRFIIGAIVMLLPLLVATYYRGLANAAFNAAKAFQPATGPEVPSLAAKVVGFIFSVNRGGGTEFFWSPDWMATVVSPRGRDQIAAFRRYRFMFWLFMASLPGWFVLVSRLFWQ